MENLTVFVFIATIIGVSSQLFHYDALAQLQDAGIGIRSSGNCCDRDNPTCTSLDEIRQETITGLVNLKNACTCPGSTCTITVTGGTELGVHNCNGTVNHCTGYKVDIARFPCINNYIEKTYRKNGTRGDGAKLYMDGSENIYAKEGNHWDILYV